MIPQKNGSAYFFISSCYLCVPPAPQLPHVGVGCSFRQMVHSARCTYLSLGFKVSGAVERAPPLFPNPGSTWGGGPTIHILPPILGTLKLPQVLALPRALPSGSDLRLLPNLPVTAELVLGPAQSFSAQRCPLISLIWLISYPAGFLGVPGCCFPQRNVQ